MRLAVGDILNFEIMKNARVRTGGHILNERYVQWISAIEMPVENFVRKNEVVLSTAIGCGHDVLLFKKFVEDIIQSEASALIIALGRYIYDVPKEVMELAEKHNFIIIEIPWEIRFATIIEDVLRELNDRQFKEREKSEKVQQELLKLILKETSLNEISGYIQKHIGCPLVITDRAGIIQDRAEACEPDARWKYYDMKDCISTEKTPAVLPQDPMFQKFHLIEREGESILQLPILKASGDIQGYLFVLPPNDLVIEEFLNQYRVNVLEHSATTIALWLSRQNAIEETEMRLRSDFVQELAKGEFSSREQAESRAKLLGFNIKLPYVCIAGYPENLELLFKKRKQHYDSYEHWLDSMIRYIEEEIYYAAQSLKKEVMMTYQGEKLILFVEITSNENPAHHFLDLVERRLRNLLPDVIISWGIGGHQEEVTGFNKGFDQAKTALQIGRNKKGAGHRVLYENTKVDRVLLTLAQNEEMKEIIVSAIEPLIQYDQQRTMDLIGTFTTYNECHGNVSQTARLLNLHRQSLLYRLRKIETLTGLSLIDTDDLFLLDLSIKTWKLGLTEARYPINS
ncbi:PucR family transcriptional regulator ligand-binding domain-containing protein [Fictibacillus sp. WQ 8-8]|uniref:PucR family transcriptional regulator n=1 Tax=Fictibacillus sp. WQ 8-8 TaxID=2938788 RepID=UPI00210D9C3B|nr:PucR family transcriptional regulator [Fictibacillus sp. WQ 8-8]MCQ6267619.1 PucR family transcriptional regulator ligand-binding domain-containing protein [Fictibacillus sp. WQ 8-8]